MEPVARREFGLEAIVGNREIVSGLPFAYNLSTVMLFVYKPNGSPAPWETRFGPVPSRPASVPGTAQLAGTAPVERAACSAGHDLAEQVPAQQ
ncbi:hypothetical protein GCM10009713_30980 [Brevibacterium celere]